MPSRRRPRRSRPAPRASPTGRSPTSLDALLGTRRDDADPQALRLARDSARRWERRLGASDTAAADLDLAGLLTSVAFPDRIARRRDDGGSFLLASGAGVAIDPDDGIARHQWLAVAETEGVGADARSSRRLRCNSTTLKPSTPTASLSETRAAGTAGPAMSRSSDNVASVP